MTTPRIYIPQELPPASNIVLDAAASHRLLNVLRLKRGAAVLLFNGKGGEVEAHFIDVQERCAVMELGDWHAGVAESSLFTHLGQAIARGDKMDFIVQKAVELGINVIAPLLTDHSNIKLDPKRAQERVQHWQKIAIHASEQCGRCQIAQILPPQPLTAWVASLEDRSKLKIAEENEMLKIMLEPPDDFGPFTAKPANQASPFAFSFPALILKENKFSWLAPIDPSSLVFQRGGEERATGVYTEVHDCRERRCQQSWKPKCEGYIPKPSRITLAVGAEGGFSAQEKKFLLDHNFISRQLGPRILRTETAALVALSILQACCGDIT
jgi:16S rRNA (uracil1498-N3)-methyltransferase